MNLILDKLYRILGIEELCEATYSLGYKTGYTIGMGIGYNNGYYTGMWIGFLLSIVSIEK